ncbi:MAG: hypothetical protein ACLQNE_29390 [Thermoguttaceae bacterium]
MGSLRDIEQQLDSLTRGEKAQLLQWVARDLGDAFPGIESTPGIGWYRRPQDPILNSDGAWQVVFARIFDEIYGP